MDPSISEVVDRLDGVEEQGHILKLMQDKYEKNLAQLSTKVDALEDRLTETNNQLNSIQTLLNQLLKDTTAGKPQTHQVQVLEQLEEDVGQPLQKLSEEVIDQIYNNECGSSLSLISTSMSDREASTLAEALKSNSCLTELEISESEVSDRGCASIARVLSHNTTLRKLKFRDNTGTGDETAESLAVVLDPEINSTLISLSLWKTKVTDNGLLRICEMLKRNNHIKEFDFGDGEVSDLGMRAIADMLKVNIGIESLTLWYSPVCDKFVLDLLENTIKRPTRLQKLFLINDISNEVGSIVAAIRESFNVEEMTLVVKSMSRAVRQHIRNTGVLINVDAEHDL